MNQLEKAILDGAKTAQRKYEEMTGWWLSHAPESFIEHAVVSKVASLNLWVFPEASPKKIMKEMDHHPRGRPPKNLGQRFDVVVWKKVKNEIKAIVEIKIAWDDSGLLKDRDKIYKYFKNNECVKAGYLLAYTEAKKTDTLSKRLEKWANKLKCNLVGCYINMQGDGEWFWAIGLFKLNRND